MAPKQRKPRKDKGKKREKRILAGAPVVSIKPDLDRYKVSRNVRTESGAPSVDIGDATAKRLRGKELDEVYKIAAKELDASEKSLRDRYTHLNPGQQRMCLGNRLRAAAKKEKKQS